MKTTLNQKCFRNAFSSLLDLFLFCTKCGFGFSSCTCLVANFTTNSKVYIPSTIGRSSQNWAYFVSGSVCVFCVWMWMWVLSASQRVESNIYEHVYGCVCSLCVVLTEFQCVRQKVTEPYRTLIHQCANVQSLERCLGYQTEDGTS